MEVGTQSLEWVAQEFAGADLSDKRLERRLIKTAEHLARSPASPINEACGDWANTQASYRLFDNPKATPVAILEPHIRSTVQRMSAYGGPVLVMQDTVFFSYGTHPKTKGLGPIGKSNRAGDRGLIMHNALAFTATGVPLGLLSQRIWARAEVPEGGHQEKIERLRTAIEEKESAKWLQGQRDTVAHSPPGVPVVTIADRESDVFEFLTQAEEQGAQYLIRARTNRKLAPEDNGGCDSLLEALHAAAVQGHLTKRSPATASVRRARPSLRSGSRRPPSSRPSGAARRRSRAHGRL